MQNWLYLLTLALHFSEFVLGKPKWQPPDSWADKTVDPYSAVESWKLKNIPSGEDKWRVIVVPLNSGVWKKDGHPMKIISMPSDGPWKPRGEWKPSVEEWKTAISSWEVQTTTKQPWRPPAGSWKSPSKPWKPTDSWKVIEKPWERAPEEWKSFKPWASKTAASQPSNKPWKEATGVWKMPSKTLDQWKQPVESWEEATNPWRPPSKPWQLSKDEWILPSDQWKPPKGSWKVIGKSGDGSNGSSAVPMEKWQTIPVWKPKPNKLGPWKTGSG